MNKQSANRYLDLHGMDIESAKKILGSAKNYGMSCVNRTLTKKQAIDIFSKAIAKYENEFGPSFVLYPCNKPRLGCEIVAKNIVREFI